MKGIVLVITALVFINLCNGIPKIIEGNGMLESKQGKDVRKLSSTSIDGRSAPAGEEIHHVCSLGSYPCRATSENSEESTQDAGGN
ncbi:hypothetical protein BRADI_5g02820v3 [Brachypodium distachyon]|uniref:Uncharacterized protein n=1 Tax=Brachypodium distachyon TaxID=15368 RepID=A0A0Q3I6R2_BRADI|nr:hypothetical protein BRADI_5g02820v3 [Brachypodium distachyon]